MRLAVFDRRYLELGAFPAGIPPRLTLRAAEPPRRYNCNMARKSDMRGRRIARSHVAIMGGIRALTPQELAEFIDRAWSQSDRPSKPRSLPTAAPRHSLISCPNDLPLPATLSDLSITLTYTLAVRAIRKGNPIAKSRLISNARRLAYPRVAERDYFLFLGWFFLSCGYRELILSLARTPESRGYEEDLPAGCPILLPLWRPLRPTGRTP